MSSRLKTPWALVLPVAFIPIAYAVAELGRWHPDEVYQFLEPAFRRVHGYGVVAWEWQDQHGIRNWFVPLIFSWCLRLAGLFGVEHPHGYRAFVALPQLLLQLAMVAAVWRSAARHLQNHGSRWVLFAFMLVVAYAPLVIFSGRTMGESLSAAFLLIAFERLEGAVGPRRGAEVRPWRMGAVGGALLGLAVVARYGSAVFVVAALVWLMVTLRWRTLLATCAGGGVVALLLGALDWATWGSPFHSLIKYADYNVLSGRAEATFGSSPGWFYLPFLGAWVAPWAWPGLVTAVVREKRVPLSAFAAVSYLVAISLTPHKEERFMYPALVLLAFCAAPHLAWLIRKIRSAPLRFATCALALLAGSAAWFYAPDFRGDQFRAQIKATRDESVTGLLIVGEGLWGSGGQFYIGRDIPFFNADLPAHIRHTLRSNPQINRAITFDGMNVEVLRSEGFEPIDRVGRETILARKEAVKR